MPPLHKKIKLKINSNIPKIFLYVFPLSPWQHFLLSLPFSFKSNQHYLVEMVYSEGTVNKVQLT